MRAIFRERPPWLARVDVNRETAGAGVLVGPDLVLTCSHVVPADAAEVVLVHADHASTAAVEFRAPIAADGGGDLAVLRLATPANATTAPLRVRPVLSDHDYLVQGFAGGHHAESRGRLGGRVGPGWVQMDDVRGVGHVLDRGFSGAPVWDDTIGAVIGIVVAAHRSARGGYLLPLEEIVRWWPRAAAFTGWRLDLDDAFDTHWLPRARGVEPHESTEVSHFVGRRRVLTELAEHLAAEPDGRVRVVTGSPGSGKSAVLARTAVLAARSTRHLIPPDELSAEPPPVDVLTVAVHARGRTVTEVVRVIADAVEVEAADPAQLLRRLPRPTAVLLDALDEAAGGAAEEIATLLGRLAALPGSRVVVGTRLGARGASTNLLLNRLGDPVVLDLDAPDYLDHQDLVRYALRRVGDPVLAEGISREARGNFLIAQLACLSGTDRLPSTVGAAVDDYLRTRFERPQRVRDLLLPLAFAEGKGLAEGPLWLALANALTAAAYTARDLREVLTSAASYLVEQADHRYRLFHQALDDTLRAEHIGPAPERIVYETLRGRDDDYVRAHLPAHAATAGTLDEVLTDLDSLMTLRPENVVPYLAHAHSAAARVVAHVYRRAAHGMAEPDQRAAYFCLVARQSGFGGLADRFTDLPWRVRVPAWDAEQGQQVIGRMSTGTRLALWVDRHGRPAAFAAHDGKVTLHRARPHDLVAVDEVRSRATGLGFQAQAAHVRPDGSEVGLTVDHRGTVRRWSFTTGLREHGSTRLGRVGVLADIAMATTPDGGLQAVVTNDNGVWLLDATGEVPVVLDDLTTSGVAGGAVVAEGGRIWVTCIGDRGVQLFQVLDGRLVEVGAPVRAHRYSAVSVRFVKAGDGRLLLVSASTERRVASLVTGSGLVPLGTAEANTTALAATLDGSGVVVAGDRSGGLEAHEVSDEFEPVMAAGRAHRGQVEAVAVRDGATAFTFGEDGLVKRWDLRYAPPAPDDPPPDFGASQAGTVLVPAPGAGVLAMLTRRTGCELWRVADRLAEVGAPPGRPGDDMAHAAAATRTPEDAIIVAVLHGSGRIDTWAFGEETWTPTGSTTTPDEPRYGVLLAVGAARQRLLAVGDLDGSLLYWQWSEDGWQPLPGHRFDHQVTGMACYRIGEELRLLVVVDGQVHLVSPWRPAPLSALPTELREQWFAVGHHDGRPVAAVFDHEVGGAVARLYSLTGDGFEPLTPAWRVPSGYRAAVTGTAGDALLLAMAADHGSLHVWSCEPGMAPRVLASTEVGASIRELAWSDDHRLVVWCQVGVLELEFSLT